MKKFLVLLFFFFFSSPLFAEPPKQIVFLGDSLSDNGNLYATFLKLFPKSPPYYYGRFSNGPCWADHFANYYLTNYHIPSLNYAVGGATVILRNPKEGYLPYNLREEMKHYLTAHLFAKKDNILFVIWIGGNDYLNGHTNVDQETTTVMNETKSVMQTLIKKGAQHFLVLNLPDLAKTPYAEVAPRENLHELSVVHNKKLADSIQQLQKEYPQIQIALFDIYSLFDDIIQHPDKYNQKYHLSLHNVHDACWTGGYTVKETDTVRLNNALKKVFAVNRVKDNSNALTTHLFNSPALTQAYLTGQAYEQGLTPCDKPDEYLFWDYVHPTAVVHQLLSEVLIGNFMLGVA